MRLRVSGLGLPGSAAAMAWLTLPALLLMALAPPVVAGKGDGRLDEGRLDPSWFGDVPEFRETGVLDYVWMKPDLSLKGRTLKIEEWPDPEFLGGEERSAKDSTKAFELSELMPSRLKGALTGGLAGIAKVSSDEGDIIVSGRFVDVEESSRAKKFWVGMGAGSGHATWDLKFVDAATGELLLAAHHRVVSGTAMSEIDHKIAKWLDEWMEDLAAGSPSYAKGKVRKK